MINGLLTDGLVSVIIPVYNCGKYIAETIESVLSQTFTNYEIILIDDCSTDNSAEIIKTYTESDKRVKCYRQDINRGAAFARNFGLNRAKGQYIAFLDSDDIWESEKLQKQLEFMRTVDYRCGFSYSSYDMFDNNGFFLNSKTQVKFITTYKDILKKTLISTPTVIIDRNIVGCLNMPMRRTGQDYAYWLLMLRDNNAYGIDEVLVHVRRRKGSLSKNKLQNIKDVWETQTQLEKIPVLRAAFNTLSYCVYVTKKRLHRAGANNGKR